MNIVGKQNLFFHFWRYTFYEFQGQVLKNYLELNSECIFEILDEFPLRIYSYYPSM